MSGNQTRLDRLLLLLDTGSAAATRKTAAEQIGEISEQGGLAGIQSLMGRVRLLLRSKSWDTRIAAGQAMEAICRRMEVWKPESTSMEVDVKIAVKTESAETESQLLKQFDVHGVIQRGQVLVSSSGKEFDEIDMDPKERLAMQKLQLRETLGLGPAPAAKGEKKDPKGDIFNVQDMVKDEDLISSAPVKTEPEDAQKKKRTASDLVDDMENSSSTLEREASKTSSKAGEADMDMLSPRERNKLRRKQRKMAQDKASQPTSSRAAGPAQSKSVVTDQPKDDSKVVVESVQVEAYATEPNEWPLAPLCDDLRHDIFDSNWEVRHGAALGLREVLKYHARAAGRWGGTTADQQEADGMLWLEECATRVLCAMALDRFGDYVSDQVVAPVRETCAQVLGVVLRHLPEGILTHVTKILTDMQAVADWEVRHGGMLGLKYLIAVREESVIKGMLRQVLPVVRGGIEGEDDDVRAVAAEALVPLAQHMVTDAECREWFTGRLLSLLWSTLLQLDDLTASTGTVMNLISDIYQHMPSTSALVVQEMDVVGEWDGNGQALGFEVLIPRLYPFFRHNIQSVRRSVLRICSNVLSFSANKGEGGWLSTVLADTLHLLFLNVILEQRADVLEASHALWLQVLAAAPAPDLAAAVSQRLASWFSAVGTPPGMPLDPSMLEGAGQVSSALAAAAREQMNKKRSKTMAKKGGASGVGGAESKGDEQGGLTSLDDFSSSVAMRLSGVRALGALLQRHEVAGLDVGAFVEQLKRLLSSQMGTQVQVAALVLGEWAWASGERSESKFVIPAELQKMLEEHLARVGQSDHPYMEMQHLTVKWKAEVQVLLKLYADANVKEAKAIHAKGAAAVEAMSSLEGLQVAQQAGDWEQKLPEKSKGGEPAKLRQKEARKVFGTIGQLDEVQTSLHTSVIGAVGAAFVAAKQIPPKVGPLIRSVMESVQREQQEALQELAAKAVVGLLRCCAERKASPNGKVLNNLCSFLCEDNSFTPRPCDFPPTVDAITIEHLTHQPPSDSVQVASTDDAIRAARTKKRGAALALAAVAKDYGGTVFASNPALWQRLHAPLQRDLGATAAVDDASAQEAIDAFQVLSVLMPAVEPSVHAEMLSLLPRVLSALPCPVAAVRQMAARALARMACVATVPVMESVIRQVLPLLGDAEQPLSRLGATEALHRLVQEMHLQVLPFAIFLVVPILGRMSDNHPAVRQTITKCFGTLLQLLPLEAGIPDPEGLSPDLVQEKHKERRFLEQLLDTSKIDNFQITVKVDAELRRYQQEGVNWMAFLLKYQLHGVLADDMGLGKTLQTICIVASDHHNRREEFAKTGLPAHSPLPSMVVCPPTLVGHWAHEVEKFVGSQLKTVQYVGSPADRAAVRGNVQGDVLVITSYDTLRNDVDFLGGFTYDYCVLDEGHVIKNAKSKTTQAIKTIKANHRLILSGTPIQNNALELWSLFDFLMPGFLGSDKYFNQVYSKPILASRNAKCSSKEAEAGALALEGLHRQVLPFMLRRTKAQVLSDLPPKIIQDYYCQLSALQQRLYNDFASKQKANTAAEIGGSGGKEDKSSGLAGHIFQALQYLKKLANHPKLVLDDKHPEYTTVMKELQDQGKTLRDVSLAPKLMALRQLLWDCGIGVEAEGGGAEGGDGAGPQHRVLIFAQMKVMLDIIEHDLFAATMPGVTFLRMDGGTPTAKRFEMQQQFNSDPTIDVLLLTTHVGGLGLNLTGADTVIFVEHDWNPMRDLQAMDRAHRIGQKNVVNVYRLITKGTLEEKIMGLQRFKLSIANSVVNEDNASLKNMDTAQLLDLFSPTDVKDVKKEEKSEATEDKAGGGKLSQVLQSLEDLWDEEQYNEAFNVDSYLASLPPAKK